MVVHALRSAVGCGCSDEGLNFASTVELCDVGICPTPLVVPRAINESDYSFQDALLPWEVYSAFKCSWFTAAKLSAQKLQGTAIRLAMIELI
jgi:hypothetical protein